MLHLYFWYDGQTPVLRSAARSSSELLPRSFSSRSPDCSRASWRCEAMQPKRRARRRSRNTTTSCRSSPTRLIGFLSIACFLPDRQLRTAARDRRPPPRRAHRRPRRVPAAVAASSPASSWPPAIGHGRQRVRRSGPRDVLVGFRADAPPFSSIKRVGEEERYEGYLVDLCNRIFTPDRSERYRMVKTEVTSADRFARSREARRSAGGPASRPPARRSISSATRSRCATPPRATSRPARGARTGSSRRSSSSPGFPTSSAARAAPDARCSASSPGRRRARSCCRPASATPSASGRGTGTQSDADAIDACLRTRASSSNAKRKATARPCRGQRPRASPVCNDCADPRCSDSEAVGIPLLPLRRPHLGRGLVLRGASRTRPSTTSATRT